MYNIELIIVYKVQGYLFSRLDNNHMKLWNGLRVLQRMLGWSIRLPHFTRLVYTTNLSSIHFFFLSLPSRSLS